MGLGVVRYVLVEGVWGRLLPIALMYRWSSTWTHASRRPALVALPWVEAMGLCVVHPPCVLRRALWLRNCDASFGPVMVSRYPLRVRSLGVGTLHCLAHGRWNAPRLATCALERYLYYSMHTKDAICSCVSGAGTIARRVSKSALSSAFTCIRLLFRTDTNDLTGGVRRGK